VVASPEVVVRFAGAGYGDRIQLASSTPALRLMGSVACLTYISIDPWIAWRRFNLPTIKRQRIRRVMLRRLFRVDTSCAFANEQTPPTANELCKRLHGVAGYGEDQRFIIYLSF